MIATIQTAPAVEPVSLTEAKDHMRIDSGSIDDALTVERSIAPGEHEVGTVNGDSADVLGYHTLVVVDSGTNQAGGTVDVKLQESENDAAWSDVSGGTFTQITDANDNAIYELEYTGDMQYLRAVAVIGVETCVFGVTITKQAATSQEDTLISTLIIAARQWLEAFTGRALISQTWDVWFQSWPGPIPFFQLPFAPLQSVTGVYYTDTAGDESTLADTEYDVSTDREPGRVSLAYGKVWPTTSLYPTEPIRIRFVAGYGDAASDVPASLVSAVKIRVADLFNNRESMGVVDRGRLIKTNTAELLAYPYRLSMVS